MNDVVIEKLQENIKIAIIHLKRLKSAHSTIQTWVKLDIDTYFLLSDVQIAITDQYLYRFSKLQDLIGEKLIKQSLDFVEETVEKVPFIDLLNKAEKIGLISSANSWRKLRESRNQIAHDYALSTEDLIDMLNHLLARKLEIEGFLSEIIDFLQNRGLNINIHHS